jgi:tyrosyl-tRNA synthetase
MGKTESGAIWLDPEKTSPYDFYQYWRNVDDPDVKNCLALLTFLPMEEVNRLGSLRDKEINRAKEILAYEVTKLVHGKEEAKKAQAAARTLFGASRKITEDMPSTELPSELFEEGMDILTLLLKTGLTSSKGEGRRLIQQGGLYLDNNRVDDMELILTKEDFREGKLLLRKGKKVYHLVKII